MKKVYFLFLICFVLVAINSQVLAQVTIDFESSGNGANYTWNTFENVDNPALAIEANPNPSGINTSSTVAKFTARATGAPYAGTETAHGDFGPLTFDASNSTVKIMVYKTVISDVGLKFSESNGEAQLEVKVANTKINEWEELTFDLTGSIGKGITGVIDQIIVFPDFADRTQENVVYFDNISFSSEDDGGSEELELVWSDEFSDDGAVNAVKWYHQTQLPSGGSWYNNEEQHYTNSITNSFAADGSLNIVAKKESFTDQGFTKEYTSARLNSKFAFKYGRIDVSAKLPSGDGTWPAIWMLGKNINEPGGYWTEQFGSVNWPATGEIDIMEHWGNNPNVIHGSLHTTSSSGSTVNTSTTTIADVSTAFHVYSIIWDKDGIQFLIDDVNFYTYNPEVKNDDTWPFDEPQYLLLNIAMGGIGGTIDPAFTESTMEIDYVRVYQKESDQEVATGTSLSDLLVDGQTIAGFSSEALIYNIELEEGTTVVPTVTAVATESNATVEITPATEIPGVTTVKVIADGGASESTYSVNFKIVDIIVPPSTLPIDFEGDAYGFIDFDGGVATVIDNPQNNEDNSSAKVAQIVRDGGATWAGSKLILTSKIDFSTNNTFRMKVYSPRVDVPVLFKLEGPNAAKEISVNTTVANGWETMVWDFTGESSDTYDELVFIFDFGAVGDGSANSTFLFDDIEFYDSSGGLSRIDLPVDFESATVNYEMEDFGDNSTVLGVDPDDATNTVAITTKTSGAATWAGTTVGTSLGFASVIPFTTAETKINVKVYSPAAGLPIRMKIEDHNDVTLTAETEAVTTKANAWEVLTFDFSNVAEGTNPFNLATNFDKLSIFFNFGVEGTDQVYYWDDVFFGEGEEIGEPVMSLLDVVEIKVYAFDGKLFIKGREELIDSRVEVYNFSGVKVSEGMVLRGDTMLDLHEKGVLIIRISDASGNPILSQKVFSN
ncbi:MAG: glycoside hydrolase family 16 protein [Reichenbachiella sp.]